jgi:hypothetical protein
MFFFFSPLSALCSLLFASMGRTLLKSRRGVTILKRSARFNGKE